MIKPSAVTAVTASISPREIKGELFAAFPALSACQVCNHPGEVTAFQVISDAKTVYRSCRVCEKTRGDMGFTPTEFYLQRVALLDDARRRSDDFARREQERENRELEAEFGGELQAWQSAANWLGTRFRSLVRSVVLSLVDPDDCPSTRALGRATLGLIAFAAGSLPIAVLLNVLFPPQSDARAVMAIVGFLSGIALLVIALQYGRPERGRGSGQGTQYTRGVPGEERL